MSGSNRLGCLLAGVALTGAACAQVSGSVAVVSDYRFRGVSLSDRRPVAQATLSYDDASGIHAGAFVSAVRTAADAGRAVQAIGHVGYAARTAGGWSWDIGAARVAYSKPRRYGYGEAHVGVASTDAAARFSYAPRYFGGPGAARYLDFNLTPGSERDLVPLFHLGLLRTSRPAEYASRSRWDARVGLAYSSGSTTLQFSWGSTSRAALLSDGGRDRSGWVLRVTRWL